jgi:hypothetical protein
MPQACLAAFLILTKPSANFNMRFRKINTEIAAEDQAVKGELIACEGIWSFSSHDPKFLNLFPSGTLYSFSNYGTTGNVPERQSFHQAVAKKVEASLRWE